MVKEFLKSKEKPSCTSGLSVDFCKNDVGQRDLGFFTETEILAMFETADYKQIDLVSPFFGEIVKHEKDSSNCMFSFYVVLVDKRVKRNGDPG